MLNPDGGSQDLRRLVRVKDKSVERERDERGEERKKEQRLTFSLSTLGGFVWVLVGAYLLIVCF